MLTNDVAQRIPRNNCLGRRPYDPTTKTFGDYVWEDYQTIQKRRKDMGAGLVHIHRKLGIVDESFGVGLWCNNRPEWQITGRSLCPDEEWKHIRCNFRVLTF